MTEPAADDANDERLMTTIDGEEVRLLVHIEPLDPSNQDATGLAEQEEGTPPNSSGLAQ